MTLDHIVITDDGKLPGYDERFDYGGSIMKQGNDVEAAVLRSLEAHVRRGLAGGPRGSGFTPSPFSADAYRFSGPYTESGKVGNWELTCRALNGPTGFHLARNDYRSRAR